MKKTLFLIVIISLILAVSSCKRADITDPSWAGPAGFNILLEGSASPALLLIDGRIHTSTIYVRVTDAMGNPLANETIFLEQLADSNSQTQVNWGYFQNNQSTFQKVTNANGEVSVTFYSPVAFYSDIMYIHAFMQVDDRAYPDSIPQDYIALTMVKSTPATEPSVVITSPPEGAVVSGTVAITALAMADSGIARVDCSIDNKLIDSKPGSTTSNSYSFSWNAALYSNGPHDIDVKAYDRNGKSTEASVHVTVNNADSAPTVAIIYPSNGANIILPAGTAITVQANATDDKGIKNVSFYVNGILVQPNMSKSSNLYEYNWTPPADGAYTLYVIAYDTINQATKSAEVNITVNANVTVSITAPSPNATVSGTAVSISALALSASGISRVDCYIDNSIIGTLSTSTNNTYTFTWNSSLVANGSHAIKVTAVDTKSLSASATINITVNNGSTGPVVNITAPAPNAIVSGTVAITALATADYGIDKMDCSIDNQLIDSKPGSTTSNSYSFSWNAAQYGNGIHTIKVTAYDKKGVSASASITVTVNNTDAVPVVAIIYPVDLSNINISTGDTIKIKVNATDDKDITYVQFYLDDIEQTPIMYKSGDSYYFDWKPTVTKSYILYVIAYDTINQKTRSATVTVTVTITP